LVVEGLLIFYGGNIFRLLLPSFEQLSFSSRLTGYETDTVEKTDTVEPMV
jgi:hypothetical protein